MVISFGIADELVELVLLRRKSSSLVAASSSSVFAVSGTLSRVEPQWDVTSLVAHQILWSSVISQSSCLSKYVFCVLIVNGRTTARGGGLTRATRAMSMAHELTETTSMS